MEDDLRAALSRIHLFREVDPSSIGVERLGGLTNRNYRLDHAGERYVLRIAGEGTSEYIDRDVEAHNAREAAAAGVGAEVLHFDASDGLMLARHLDGVTTMTPDLFASTAGAPARAAEVLARMHRSGRRFEFRFELFSMVDEYLALLGKAGDVELPDGYHDVLEEAQAVRAVLDARPAELAPCHCDPLSENFLDTGERMWLVDWEYSGMNDPLWDLGDVSVEAAFTDAQDVEMMQAYCGGEPPAPVYGRMVVYKAMADLLWTLWGLIQHVNDNPAEDFWAYSVGRFERCKSLMGTGEFGRHLAACGAD